MHVESLSRFHNLDLRMFGSSSSRRDVQMVEAFVVKVEKYLEASMLASRGRTEAICLASC